MKLAGILATASAIILTGIAIASRHKKRAELLNILSLFFDEFASISILKTTDVIKTIEQLSDTERFSVLKFPQLIISEYYYGCNIRDIWRYAVNSSPELYVLDDISSKYLQSFADNFGRNTIDNFAENCKNYSQRFYETHLKEQAACQKTGKLIVSSGFLSAAILVIVLV